MSDETTRDAAAVRFPPPLVPLIALGVGYAFQSVFGRLADPLGSLPRFGLGVLGVVGGLGLVVLAGGLFRRAGQDPKPWTTTPGIVSTGVYRWTRNPMYLGMGLVQLGLGLLFDNLWIVVLVPVSWLVIYASAIRHEEAYLERKFGDAYLDYKRSVRRWI